MLTQERAKTLFDYDTSTGTLTWLVSKGSAKAGGRAGTYEKEGYRQIRADGASYPEHRVMWLIVHGSFPCYQIDHINGIKDDNRLCNLREATPSENAMNRGVNSRNTTGFKGVTYHKAAGKYQTCIRDGSNYKYLGLYSTPEEAHEVYCKASAEHHGEFGRVK